MFDLQSLTKQLFGVFHLGSDSLDKSKSTLLIWSINSESNPCSFWLYLSNSFLPKSSITFQQNPDMVRADECIIINYYKNKQMINQYSALHCFIHGAFHHPCNLPLSIFFHLASSDIYSLCSRRRPRRNEFVPYLFWARNPTPIRFLAKPNIYIYFRYQISRRALMQQIDLLPEKTRQKIQIFMGGKDYAIPFHHQSYLVVKETSNNSSLEKQILRTGFYEDETSPTYREDLIVEFYFEKTQYLSFVLYVNHVVFAKVRTVLLFDIFKNKTRHFVFKNENDENVGQLALHSNIISIKDQGRQFEGCLHMRMAEELPDKFFFKIFRWDLQGKMKQQVQLEVYCSEPMAVSAQHKEVRWPTFKISQHKLSMNNDSSSLTIAVFKYRKFGFHSELGKFQCTLGELKRGNDYKLINCDKKVGVIYFSSIVRRRNETFLGYLENGLYVNSVICIDFTESNRVPTDPRSNHYTTPTRESKYEEIIRATIQPIMHFDRDKKVPVFGFGCKVNHEKINTGNRLSPLFPLNMDITRPELSSLEEIKNEYRQCMKYLTFSSPTYFSPLIKWASEEGRRYVKNTDHHEYMIMFIITDGQLYDEQKFADLIVECSSLPISIVIIGVGTDNFERMREFDKCKLPDSNGNLPLRDLVKFVEYQKLKEDPEKLCKEVLEEIPYHVESYFQLMNARQSDNHA